MTTRTQLSLFVPPADAIAIEAVRQLVDPVQHALIPAHVTLCREEELADPELVGARLAKLALPPLVLQFGTAESFSEYGLLLPCIAGVERYRALRQSVLDARDVREASPHITLAHPRNPRALGNAPSNASTLPPFLHLTFPTISRIEQRDGGRWRVVEEWRLGNGNASS